MDIVVDTSTVIAVVADEPAKSALVDRTRGARLFAPRSVHWEIGNALSAMLKRGRITEEQALRAIDAYLKIPIDFIEMDLSKSLRLASSLGIYAYDAYIIACALDLNIPLISLDRGLLSAARQANVAIVEVQP